MKNDDRYKFVRDIQEHSNSKLTFIIRNPNLYNPRSYNVGKILALTILIILFTVQLVIAFLIDNFALNISFMIGLTLLYLYYSDLEKTVYICLLQSKDRSQLEYIETINNKSIILNYPIKIRVIYRYYPIPKAGKIIRIVVEIVGQSTNDIVRLGEIKSEHFLRVASVPYTSTQDAYQAFDKIYNSYKFLEKWLEIPLVKEEILLFKDSSRPAIF
ncbi:hypothetical protein [Alkanindiges illinoisensis]|uniref:hypothetical protein n=1 Tax=Alkanindiges illinoisensis TaxID=197183 RepID=UPI00047C548A|nr:hypothetical protein [Alkanindiges illinoisensis]